MDALRSKNKDKGTKANNGKTFLNDITNHLLWAMFPHLSSCPMKTKYLFITSLVMELSSGIHQWYIDPTNVDGTCIDPTYTDGTYIDPAYIDCTYIDVYQHILDYPPSFKEQCSNFSVSFAQYLNKK